jgi:hypothetical protein
VFETFERTWDREEFDALKMHVSALTQLVFLSALVDERERAALLEQSAAVGQTALSEQYLQVAEQVLTIWTAFRAHGLQSAPSSQLLH